jgi:hypothetical protein
VTDADGEAEVDAPGEADGDPLRLGEGLGLGLGVRLGVGVADGVGDGEGDGVMEGVGLGVGLGEGVGVKVGIGALGPGVSSVSQAYALPDALDRTRKPTIAMPARAKRASRMPP